MSSKELADYLLYEAGVAGLNGGCFGEYGDGYIRFSYANSLENLMEAVSGSSRSRAMGSGGGGAVRNAENGRGELRSTATFAS